MAPPPARPPGPAAPAPDLAPAPGARVGRFRLLRELGRGHLGVVFEARDDELGRTVALRLLRAGPGARDQAGHELESLAALHHPGLVTLFDVGRGPHGPWLVEELVRGEILAARLARGALPPAQALAVGVAVGRALAHAHARGAVHLGLAPGNVLLAEDGTVKLLGFGLARALGVGRAEAGELEYAAPEQRAGAEGDARADVHALGALVQALLDGAAPAPGAAPPRPCGAARPAGLDAALARLTAEAPAARPPDAAAALALLAPFAAAPAPARPPAPASRRRRTLLAAALAVGLALAGLALLRLRGPPPRPAVAVLPFADLSGDGSQEYFAEGLSEELLDALAQVPDLHVAARTSAFSFKGHGGDLRAVGRALGVDAVVEGSLRRDGQRVRITAQLIKTEDGFHLWSGTFDRELSGVFAVQDEIAEAVVAALEVRLLEGPAPTSQGRRTSDPRAHDLYLLGRRLARDDTPEGGRLAAETFERAIALDPRYAPAWAALSNAVYWGWADEAESPEAQRASRARALAAAERAVALDPAGSLGYVARGFLRASLSHDWAGARADLERALAISPGMARHHLFLARYVLGPMGLRRQAVAEAQRATELDPLNAKAWGARCELLVADGQAEAARAAATRSLELAPEQVIAPACLATAALVAGRPGEAAEAARRVADPLYRRQLEAAALHDLGQREAARAALEAMVAAHGVEAPFQIAGVHAWRGEADRAFEWLARAEAASDPGLPDLKLDPLLLRLRGDPRWAALLGRLALPPD